MWWISARRTLIPDLLPRRPQKSGEITFRRALERNWRHTGCQRGAQCPTQRRVSDATLSRAPTSPAYNVNAATR